MNTIYHPRSLEHPGPPLVKSAVSISPARLAYLEACEREADAANTWEIAWDNDAENVNEKWRDYQKARTARDAARSKL